MEKNIGVKKTILDELESLKQSYNKMEYVDSLVLDTISKYTEVLNREISVFISRSGILLDYNIGDFQSVELKSPNGKRSGKLSGIRCIHTHPSGNERLSSMDISCMQNLKLDSISAVGVVNGKPNKMQTAYIEGDDYYTVTCKCDNIPHEELVNKIVEAERSIKIDNSTKEGVKRVIVGNFTNSMYIEEELKELVSLCSTAGLNVVGSITQVIDKPNKGTYMGSGKVAELSRLCQVANADMVIVNNELTGSQLNNLENLLGCDVLDRSMLILEIFSMHATTNEGKLQVELARLKYTLPKLLGQGQQMSRIGGGGRTKGSGETKLETDRRYIRNEINELQKRIKKLEMDRNNRRKKRVNSGIKSVAIVGYTNAGKSTLMNRITKAGVLEENKLFATLDPVTRKIFVDLNKEYLLTDTVGFIDNLPHEFIEAFKSTLEEAREADIILHVVDGSSKDMDRQMKVVDKVLAEIGAGNKPTIVAFNKVDKIDEDSIIKGDNAVYISAKSGKGIEELRDKINSMLFKIEE